MDGADTSAWGPDVEFDVPELWAKKSIAAGCDISQLSSSAGTAKVVSWGKDGGRAIDARGDEIEIRRTVAGVGDPILEAPLGIQDLRKVRASSLRWARPPEPDPPASVRADLVGRFALVEQVPFDASPGEAVTPGFRVPQIGAVHSVLGYWTTEQTRDATVVLPTGTGKTDTMVALFAAVRPERLLVLVPSDALRTQIAEKFERYGILESIGALGEGPLVYPVVGRLSGGLSSESDARRFAQACNVVIATPQSLNASTDEARNAFTASFTHLFVDEAHHVKATTWASIRAAFEDRAVVQFTATPYREDRQDLGGKLVYVFPLGLAQTQGYFSTINYRSVRSIGNEDRVIAESAIKQLRSDLEAGLDHVVMARVKRKGRADEVAKIYQELAPEFEPTVLYSGMKPVSAKRAALKALQSRESRVIVCVDMLGEGFDLPSLKIAAIHDPHKSLGITLQFVGRFARTATGVGDATVVVGRPNSLHDENLRMLYGEDRDWNVLIRDLSERATAEEEAASEFDEGFTDAPPELAAHDVRPKMSAMVYRTDCSDWDPQAVVEHIGAEHLITNPIPHSVAAQVAWFVKRSTGSPPWGPKHAFQDIEHELFAMYWDRSRRLLYINSSNNDSADKYHQRLAEAVAGNGVQRIRGEHVFRVYGGIQRLLATNVGVLDVLNRARKFTMHAGSDALSHYPSGDAETKTQTNIFANGFASGDRVHVGASISGRVWSWRAAGSLREWISWCDEIGTKLIDETIDLDNVIANFIRPVLLAERPELVVLAADWPASVYESLTDNLRVRHAGIEHPIIDAELVVTDFQRIGPVKLAVRTADWEVDYELTISEQGMSATPATAESVTVVTARTERSLEAYIKDEGVSLLLEQDAVIEPPGVLLKPAIELAGFPRGNLRTHVDWNGVDITTESQGPSKNPASIQRRVIETMIEHGTGWLDPSQSETAAWEVVIDDDGANELADVVGMRRDGGFLDVQLVHCKYSSEPKPGARIVDLYEVCGQASKSVARRRDVSLLVPHLIRREGLRSKAGRVGFEVGDAETLYDIDDHRHTLRLRLNIVIVQPGVSAKKASEQQLDLLASTEMYVFEVGGADFEVVVSP